MNRKKREDVLKIVAAGMVGLIILNYFVFNPVVDAWKATSKRIDALQVKVKNGRSLLGRATMMRNRWAQMQQNDLPDDNARAYDAVDSAVERWQRDVHLKLTKFTHDSAPKPREGGYDVADCLILSNGSQANIARFIFDIETDPLPARITTLELTSKDPAGRDLELNVHLNFLRITEERQGQRGGGVRR